MRTKAAVLLALLAMLLCGCEQEQLTKEELAARRAACISEYEVCSVMQYAETKTNQFGGVVDTDVCYAFTYIDDDGALKSVEGFQHFDHGLTKVCLSDMDKYVTDSMTDARTLYLSRETLEKLP